MTTSVIKEEDIKKGGAYNVRDVLKPLTRLNVMEAGMTGNQVSIRGMGTSSTLILIDGRRLAGEDSGSTMNVYELNRMSLDEVECIEVMRGAGSAFTAAMLWAASSISSSKKNKKSRRLCRHLVGRSGTSFVRRCVDGQGGEIEP